MYIELQASFIANMESRPLKVLIFVSINKVTCMTDRLTTCCTCIHMYDNHKSIHYEEKRKQETGGV